MPASDRAFRALARAEPNVVIGLLHALDPGALPAHVDVTPEDVDDSRLDLPSHALDADWVARVGTDLVQHVELQGYRDEGFPERVFRYHLTLVLRYRGRRVYTTAIWLVDRPEARRKRFIVGDVTVRIRSFLLAEVPAAALLVDPLTACFAPGADAGTMTSEELCGRVVDALVATEASPRQWQMAVVAARVGGRYEQMVSAMKGAGMEPMIIEDLVKIGEDFGLEKGRKQGLEKGLARGRKEGRKEGRQKGLQKGQLVALRAVLLEVAATRGWSFNEVEVARVEAETSVERLRGWLRRALTAEASAAVFSE